ncbi:MAG TPA: sulfatase-like hydrolase/transferase, partial [Rubrobacteraceae bacterium]|nr:sulfatase-like hydrolase/transferase [Rubrobacteraceae bacterium]
GLFAAVRGGLLRWTVVVLFHLATMFVVAVTTSAHWYFQETGATLDYDIIASWLLKLDTVELILRVPLSGWILLFGALLYAALGPPLLARAFSRWRGWSRVSPAGGSRVSSTGSLLLFLLASCFGFLSLLVGFGSAGADTPLAKDRVANVVLTAAEGATGVEEASVEEAGTEATTVESEDSKADPFAERPSPANARLVQTSSTERRNVVLIHLESARAQSVTPYNENLETMPFLNELVQESLVTERTHVIVPRSSKGSTAVNCGIEPALYAGPEYEPGVIPAPCLASLLRKQGYRTAWFQSLWDTGDDSSLAANFGYEDFYPSQSTNTDGFQVTNTFGYEDDVMIEPSERWLKVQGNEGPFLAQYFTSGAHYGYECVPNRYGYEHFSEDEELDRYHNCLRMLDFFLNNLFDQYKRLGLYENTIFVLYGDHGEGFKEHGRDMHGDTIWEEGLHVPLIFHAPGWFESGEQSKGPSSQLDILPTVLEMLGYEVEGGEYPGYSLLHPLPKDRTVMSNCITNRRCMASLKGTEKYIHHFDDQPDELFDLSQDPLEKRNLASERGKEELDKRREELFAWRTRVNAQHGRILVNGNPVLGEE